MCILISLLDLIQQQRFYSITDTETRPRRIITMHIKEYLNRSPLWKGSMDLNVANSNAYYLRELLAGAIRFISKHREYCNLAKSRCWLYSRIQSKNPQSTGEINNSSHLSSKWSSVPVRLIDWSVGAQWWLEASR